MLEAELVMRFQNDPEPSLQLFQRLDTDGFSDQTRHAIAPFVIQAFNNAGFAAAFSTGPVLPVGKQLGIRLIEVGCPLGG